MKAWDICQKETGNVCFEEPVLKGHYDGSGYDLGLRIMVTQAAVDRLLVKGENLTKGEQAELKLGSKDFTVSIVLTKRSSRTQTKK